MAGSVAARVRVIVDLNTLVIPYQFYAIAEGIPASLIHERCCENDAAAALVAVCLSGRTAAVEVWLGDLLIYRVEAWTEQPFTADTPVRGSG